jgi:hypothetical protein
MRPRGEIRVALVKAFEQGPATVQAAAQRVCVGKAAASYTASRMVADGELVVVQPGKPAVFAVRQQGAGAVPGFSHASGEGQDVVHALDILDHFWRGLGMR